MTIDVPAQPAIALLVVSLLVGVVVGLTGMGGGALMTPALMMLGVPAPAAVANDLVAAAVTKSIGAGVHWRQRSPNLRLAAWLIIGSVPMAFAGSWITHAVGASGKQERFITVTLGCALLFTAGTYLLRTYVQLRGINDDRKADLSDPTTRPTSTLLIGAFGGVLVGITSVGSGSLIMVALLFLYPTLSPVRLVGTDLVQAVPLVLSAAVGHVLLTGVDWGVLVPLLLGASPGTFLGSRIANRVPQKIIRCGVVIVLSLTGLKMLGVPPTILGVSGLGLLLIVTAAAIFTRRRSARGVPPHACPRTRRNEHG